MGAQPGSKGFGFAVGEQIDGLVAFEIHQNRAKDLAAQKRKIVDSQHAWGHEGWGGRRTNLVEQGISAGGAADLLAHPLACLSTQCKPNRRDQVHQADGLAAIRDYHCGEPLGEDNASAGWVVTKKPAHMEAHLDRQVGPRQISYPSLVAGMHTLRGALAERAAGFGSASDHFHQNRLPFGFKTEQVKAGGVGHEGRRGHGGTLLPPSSFLAG
jgi:hypothetical protein